MLFCCNYPSYNSAWLVVADVSEESIRTLQ